jgi:hypothetical protein
MLYVQLASRILPIVPSKSNRVLLVVVYHCHFVCSIAKYKYYSRGALMLYVHLASRIIPIVPSKSYRVLLVVVYVYH